MNSLPGSSMEHRRRPRLRPGVTLTAAVLAAAVLSVCLGPVPLSLSQIGAVLLGQDTAGTAAQILLYVRLPRTCAALLTGGALAVSGAVIQRVLANPLAAPNVIGVNAGAGFAVALICALRPGAAVLVPLAAFAGALVSVLLVLLLGERTGASRLTLVLAGIAVSTVFSGAVELVLTFVPDALSGYADYRSGDGTARPPPGPAHGGPGSAALSGQIGPRGHAGGAV